MKGLENTQSFALKRSLSSPSNSLSENIFKGLLYVATSVSVVTTIGIVVVLLSEAIQFFKEISFVEFFTGTQWTPLIEPKHFGILPLVCGTLLVGVGASLIAVPVGVASALFLSEYVRGSLRTILKSTLEVLAGIPTVVYGYLAITFVTPQLQQFIPNLEVFNALSAAIVVGIMIIPTISSVSQDAFEAVPRELRDAAYGLGGRKHQVAMTVVFPAALSGFVASVILGFSRAIGETMAVTLAAGSTPKLSFNPLQSIQTMTSYIVQVSLGDTPAGTIEYRSIFVVGLTLFSMTLISNLIAQWFSRRFQERYL
ncbi:MAG: Phosphate transport system permease protein [Bacteriovoracaceae bacterium]|nr:Phosphate transport system permease protein [Bacteriovoracaceae bacterium]